MLHSFETATASVFLLLSVLLLMLWSWAMPELWSALDLRITVATVGLTAVALGWGLHRIREATDPELL